MAKALLLLSGGIDSPVAGFLVKERGNEVVALHLTSRPFVGEEVEEKCRRISKHLGFSKFLTIDIGKELEEIASNAQFDLYYVLQKRLLLRKACEVAAAEGCEFIVTGDNLGQVSSQTLSNMRAITEASVLPVARPVVCLDKEEIISIARRIGTFELSKGPESCCVLGPKHPATRSSVRSVKREEELLWDKTGAPKEQKI